MRIRRTPAGAGIPLLARMQVGTKLLLLALLPVCALLALTAFSVAEKWREADRLSEFHSATESSFDVASVAQALGSERMSTVIDDLGPASAAPGQLAAARRRVDAIRRTAVGRAVGHEGPVDVTGRLDAAGRELRALRLRGGRWLAHGRRDHRRLRRHRRTA